MPVPEVEAAGFGSVTMLGPAHVRAQLRAQAPVQGRPLARVQRTRVQAQTPPFDGPELQPVLVPGHEQQWPCLVLDDLTRKTLELGEYCKGWDG